MVDVTIPIVIGFSVVIGGIVMVPATKFALDIAPYLYSNTRLSARTGMMLKKKNYDELMSASTIREQFAILESTYYAKVSEHAKDFSSFSQLIEEDLIENYEWLTGAAPKVISPVIAALAKKFEINELKKAINKLSIKGTEVGELKHLPVELRSKIEGVKNFHALAFALEGTEYAGIITPTAADNIASVTTELDRLYLEEVRSQLFKLKGEKGAEPFIEYWDSMIDFFNLRLLMRRISNSTDAQFIETKRLTELESVNDLAQLESILSKTQYGESIKEYTREGIEQGFYSYLKNLARNLSVKYSMRAGMIASFIIEKELEARNLNTILKLKSEGFKPEEIEKYLVI